ncbi:coil containing protein [Vibrio phage P23]|nr:coil containing protein [Vibrio phage P23]
MRNEDMPAMPQMRRDPWGNYHHTGGLTKREMFAMHAMQSLILSLHDGAMKDHWGYPDDKTVARQSVHYADALLKELEK